MKATLTIIKRAWCTRKSIVCMLYFLLSILMVGTLTVCLFLLPLAVLGIFFRPFVTCADYFLYLGIRYLLFPLQSWVSLDLEIPKLKGPLLIVSNHRSHLDVFLLLSRVPGIRVLAKHSLFFVPFLGFVMWITRQVPVRRKSGKSFWNSMRRIQSRWAQGDLVHVFPEMTRCPEGFQGTQAFMTAPFWAAKQSGVSILPLVVLNTDAAWPKGSFGLRSGVRVSIRSLGLINPHDFETADLLRDHVREMIDRALQSQAAFRSKTPMTTQESINGGL